MCFLAEMPVLGESFLRLTAGGARILVCEDEGLTALRLQRVLTRLGYDVVGQARDGEEAVRLAEQVRPDIILMDVSMPKMDGIEATRRIMGARPAAILMLTAYSEPEVVQRALAAGASGYLVKPVVDEQLHTGIAVARARFVELQREHEVAGSLAAGFRSLTAQIPGFQVASRYQPASDQARVGGDFFDFVELGEERIGIVIGDACGSGIPSAVYTGMARHMLRAYAVEDPTPGRVLRRLNRALYQQTTEECPYVTMVYGVLNRASLSFVYVNAGHPAPVLYEPDPQRCRELSATGGIVGAVPHMEFAEAQVTLGPGAVLALYTDGITEARAGTELLGSAAVDAVVEAHATESADAVAEAILDSARRFSGGHLHDDVAIVVLKNG